MANFNDYFANMGANALSGMGAVSDALDRRQQIQNRMTLSGKLPQLIEQYGVTNRNMPTEQKLANQQYLSLLAGTDPEEAMKYLMQLNRESGMNRNYDVISQAIGEGLQAYRQGISILRKAELDNHNLLPNYKIDYDEQFDLWKNAMIKASQAGATEAQLKAVGVLGAFEDYFTTKEKQKIALEVARTGLSTSQINQQIAQSNLGKQGLEYQKLQSETAKNRAESSVAETEAQKKISERPIFLGKIAGKLNNLVSYAKELDNPNEKIAVSSANLLLTGAGKELMGALSNDEFRNLTGNSGSNWENLVNKYNPFATLTSATPEIAYSQGRKFYDNVKSEYDAVYNTLSPQERALVKVKPLPFPTFTKTKSGFTQSKNEKFEGAIKQYIPQVGDTPQVLALKKKQRDAMIKMMVNSQGVSGKNQGGKIVNTGKVKM